MNSISVNFFKKQNKTCFKSEVPRQTKPREVGKGGALLATGPDLPDKGIW